MIRIKKGVVWYQRELEKVGEALAEIEEDQRAEVCGANVWQEKFNEGKRRPRYDSYARLSQHIIHVFAGIG